MKRSFLWCLAALTVSPLIPRAQTVQQLVEKVKAKIDQVKDYTATGRMKTNVSFLKVPVANVVIYFRKPDQLKIKNEKGISFVPRGAVSINLNNVLSNGAYTVLDAGKDKVNGIAPLPPNTVFLEVFQRAVALQRLAELWDETERRHDDRAPFNPFRNSQAGE